MNTEVKLSVLNLRAAHKTWSRQRMLQAIAVAQVMALLSCPVSAFAAQKLINSAQHNVTATSSAATQTASATHNASDQHSATEKTAPAAASTTEPAAPAVSAASVRNASAPVAPVASTAVASVAVPATPVAPAAAPVTPAAGPVATSAAAAPASSRASRPFDTLGTSINFDFNKDGKTDEKDEQDFKTWIDSYEAFKTDPKTGYKYNVHGGLSATGALALIVNGNIKPAEKGDISGKAQDVSKVKKYFLINLGQSTPVKNQGAFGTCWTFSSAAVLESSILKKEAGAAGTVIDPAKHTAPNFEAPLPSNIDVSELLIALKSYTPQSDGPQKGEGVSDVRPGYRGISDSLNSGGYFSNAEVLFTNWQGIASEAEQPYFPNAAASYTLKDYIKALIEHPEYFSDPTKWALKAQSHAASVSAEKPSVAAASVNPTNAVAKPVAAANAAAPAATAKPASSIGARVNEVVYIPSPNNFELDKHGDYVWTSHNDASDTLIKEALVKYGAVQIGINADVSLSSDFQTGNYFNYKHIAQYNDKKKTQMNHGVTIVGWDDTYSAKNFKGAKNDISKLKDGAWLVKNSWGAAGSLQHLAERFGKSVDDVKKAIVDYVADKYKNDPDVTKEDIKYEASSLIDSLDGNGWGIKDPKSHKRYGYFWLSYYDRSITGPQALGVDIAKDGYDYDNLYSHDYLINTVNTPFALSTKDTNTKVANVFVSRGDETLRAVSAYTVDAHMQVDIEVYTVPAAISAASAASRSVAVNYAGPLAATAHDTNPLAGAKLVSSQSEKLAIPGFHTIKLNTPVRLPKGQKFIVVQKLVSAPKSAEKVSWLNLETGLAQSALWPRPNDPAYRGRPNRYYWTHVVANPGETYTYLKTNDGYQWVTPRALSYALGQGSVLEFGNAKIKAFTTNGLIPEPTVPKPAAPKPAAPKPTVPKPTVPTSAKPTVSTGAKPTVSTSAKPTVPTSAKPAVSTGVKPTSAKLTVVALGSNVEQSGVSVAGTAAHYKVAPEAAAKLVQTTQASKLAKTTQASSASYAPKHLAQALPQTRDASTHFAAQIFDALSASVACFAAAYGLKKYAHRDAEPEL